ncbi:MAG: GreA/GreB family elongation factor [Treponema sp.]|jgi:transcription elongation factor GreA|nr:GreA/GreB family elongation factor [Treponema sp.]
MSEQNAIQPENSLSAEALTLLKNVREMLNEEKWTRAALSNYSTGQFKEFDSLLKEARELRVVDEMKKDCDEHLAHSKNSIIALYLSGMIALSRQIIDDAAMINLVTIFADNHKWAIVKYLCERILDHGESKYALRSLIDCYKNENNEDALYGIWERLVKVDYEEAELAKALAEHYEKQGNNEAAVDYYKKALHRFINKSLFANVKEIWEKLLIYCPDDIDFFFHVQKKVAKTISEERAIDLLKLVYASCKDRDVDTAIAILKIVLQYDEKDYPARKEIVECYKKKFAGHSHLEDYIRVSNLTQSYRNVHEAITDFEKHIAFDKGNYVFHRTWGVGKIAGIEGDEIKINFSKKAGHTMSLKMAVSALQILSKEHIWVIRATWSKEKLQEKIKADIPWALRTIIKSSGNSCDLKKIKAELCPGVLSEKEWTSWSGKARDILKSDPNFGVSPDNIDIFTVRERPISISEKLYNEFKAERNFFARTDIIRNFISHKNAEIDSDYFAEMLAFFTSSLKTANQGGEQAVAAYLLVKDIAAKFPHLGVSVNLNFAEVFKNITNVPELYSNLKDSRFREEFLKNIQIHIPDWADIFIQIFPKTMDTAIIDKLEEEHGEKLTSLILECFENFKEHREAVVWLFRMYSKAKAETKAKTKAKGKPEAESKAEDETEAEALSKAKAETRVKWYEAAGISEERQLIILIHILDLTYRDIENQRETTEARKINKQIYTILVKEDVLGSFLDAADTETISRIYRFVNDVKNLDPQDKLNLRSRIQDKHQDFKFIDSMEKRISQGLTVTRTKFEEKQKQLVNIMDVEIPANSREIESARMHGDLKENAEYIAAKEKQVLLNTTAERLKEDLDRAQLFDPSAVDLSRVSFGTFIILRNNTKDRKEEYTILGPWESDPENNVISYLAPFGKIMMGKTEGEQFNFTSDGEKISYTVETIKAAVIP